MLKSPSTSLPPKPAVLSSSHDDARPSLDLLDQALETYRRKLFFDQVNAGYAALRADPHAWAEHQAERQLWDTTLMEGLEPDELWTEDGRCLGPEKDQA